MFINYFKNDVYLDKSKLNIKKVRKFYKYFDRQRNIVYNAMKATVNPIPVADILEEIQCPSMLIWGENDKLIPLGIGRSLYRKLGNSVLKIVFDCGHSPLDEYPDIVKDTIFKFCNNPSEVITAAV
jgi:pimeloyl-ACP methyl ester carboxylesterase